MGSEYENTGEPQHVQALFHNVELNRHHLPVVDLGAGLVISLSEHTQNGKGQVEVEDIQIKSDLIHIHSYLDMIEDSDLNGDCSHNDNTPSK